jgi:hypothetical protein
MRRVNTVLRTPLVSDTQIPKYSGMPSCECAYDQFPSTLHVIMPQVVKRLDKIVNGLTSKTANIRHHYCSTHVRGQNGLKEGRQH